MTFCFKSQVVEALVVRKLYPEVKVIAIVPEVVKGTPETVRPVGTDASTEVTVPEPADHAEIQLSPERQIVVAEETVEEAFLTDIDNH